jgi:hypothetical protein
MIQRIDHNTVTLLTLEQAAAMIETESRWLSFAAEYQLATIGELPTAVAVYRRTVPVPSP